ncbi:MAG: lysS, partial [Nocardioides sp.]|nr:lysS [Nocardioides sp.]
MARSKGQQGGEPVDWVTRAADDAIRHAGEGNRVTVSSGISPSGPVHLGNLREVLTVHFVADEIARRGVPVRHLHVWDDYDRFRKVPAGIDASYAEHIGRPLSAVPDPTGEFPSWAERWKAPLLSALDEMGVELEQVSQTERYTSGFYRDQVLHAVSRRDDIEAVMARYRTKAPPAGEDAAAAGIPFPYKPYCRQCGRDTTIATAYDDATTTLSYTCSSCGFTGTTNLSTDFEGKLVWKVDWPMRWALEKVDFEPAGDDHATPGSSFTVGKELVTEVFGARMPTHFGYSFVGIAGMAKMSSSRGGVPTAADALRILEAPILRWLYVRRQPRQV